MDLAFAAANRNASAAKTIVQLQRKVSLMSTICPSMHLKAVLILAMFAVWPAESPAESPLARWVPGACNGIAIINVRKLINTPLGKKGKWSDKVRTAYTEGLLSAPSWTRQVVRATTLGTSAQQGSTVYSLY